MRIGSVRRLTTGLLVAAIFCAVLIAASPAFAYSISGTVVDAATGQPVPGGYDTLELQLWYWDANDLAWYRAGVYAAPSNSTGSYTLNCPWDQGQYRVQCYNDPNYNEQWWNLAPSAADADTITVNNNDVTNIDFALQSTTPPQKKSASFSLGADHVCDYRFAVLAGSMYESMGPPMSDRLLTVQATPAGTHNWRDVGTVITRADGHFTFIAHPARKTSYRFMFAGDDTYYATDTGVLTVTPRVEVTKPSGPVDVPVGVAFPSISYLWPRHAAGTRPVSVQRQHFEGGHWVTKKSVPMLARDYGGYTRLGAHVTLGSVGRWRIRAFHAEDDQNAATYSAWRYVNAR